MPISWPKQRRLIGTKVPRLDGPDKATGRAKYSFDINRPGMLHAMILRCPHAHAKLESLDTSGAEKMPGVKAVHVIAQPGKAELYFAGDEVVALAADTEEHAHDALRAIKVKYQVLDFIVFEDDALKNDKKTMSPVGPKQERENVRPPQEQTKGNVDEGFKDSEVIHEATYGVPVICHQCLESHGMVAEWSKLDTQEPQLTVWCSTQAVVGTAGALTQTFKARFPKLQVKCITEYMGGGFGSKFGPDIQGTVCCELALKAKAPVKLMLDRAEEVVVGGTRPSAYGKVKIGAKKDGTIVAYSVETYGTGGVANAATVNINLLPYVYMDAVPNWKRKVTVVRTNAATARAMRAPGHPQNCVLTDCPLDDLAAKIGMDPLEMRIKNLPPNTGPADPSAWATIRNTVYRAEIEIAAKLADWKKKWHPPGKGPGSGVLKHGIGMALHTWGGAAQGQANEVTVIISRDGSVTTQTSSQDLGTGQKTLNAIVAAEVLGLKPTDIITKLGDNQYGPSGGSGGSTTCPTQAPATLIAATAARDDLFAKIAPKLNAKKEDLEIQEGKVVDKASKKSYEWKQACAALGMNEAKGTGIWNLAEAVKPENKGISNVQVGGVQIAEVLVDIETGVVKCTHVVAVQDCGLVVNKLCCESQVAGGVIMGVNYALFEERIMDRATGRQCNPDMEFYKLGGIVDMPKITVHMHDMPERGVIGIGEPPTISTCAAVGNAVFNAIGVRVPNAPYTPDRVLAALAGKKA